MYAHDITNAICVYTNYTHLHKLVQNVTKYKYFSNNNRLPLQETRAVRPYWDCRLIAYTDLC